MPQISRRFLIAISLSVCLAGIGAANADAADRQSMEPLSAAKALFARDPDIRNEARKWIAERGDADMASALIQAMRFSNRSTELAHSRQILAKLVGADAGPEWHDWMLWQQAHPEIKPFAGFDRFKAGVMGRIDPNFLLFLKPDAPHEIRLEEIVWGGVSKDGIPDLREPELVSPIKAPYLRADELVFGVALNGDVRAYPLRIMDWHEMPCAARVVSASIGSRATSPIGSPGGVIVPTRHSDNDRVLASNIRPSMNGSRRHDLPHTV